MSKSLHGLVQLADIRSSETIIILLLVSNFSQSRSKEVQRLKEGLTLIRMSNPLLTASIPANTVPAEILILTIDNNGQRDLNSL